MASSLSDLVNNLADEIHKIKFKYGHNYKKCKTCRIKCKGCDCSLEYKNVTDDMIEYQCFCCYKTYQKCLIKVLKKIC